MTCRRWPRISFTGSAELAVQEYPVLLQRFSPRVSVQIFVSWNAILESEWRGQKLTASRTDLKIEAPSFGQRPDPTSRQGPLQTFVLPYSSQGIDCLGGPAL